MKSQNKYFDYLFILFFIMFLFPVQKSPAQTFGGIDPNIYWDTKMIGGVNGQFQYGTSASVVDKNGVVYIAGQVYDGTQYVVKIGMHDGTSWQLLDVQLENANTFGQIYDMDIDIDGNLYLLGEFNVAREVASGPAIPVNNLVKLDMVNMTWSSIGLGLQYLVSGLSFNIEVDAQKNIYIGGGGGLNGINLNSSIINGSCILKWDEGAQLWDDMLGGLAAGNGAGPAVAGIEAAGQDIFIIGQFMEAEAANGSTITDLFNAARWDGSGWNKLGNLPAGVIPGFGRSLASDASGNIYFCFDDRSYFLKWDGAQWTDFGGPGVMPGDLVADNLGMVYCVFADFNFGRYAISRYDGTNWERVGVFSGRPITSSSNFDFTSPRVFVGGSYNQVFNPVSGRNTFAVNNAYWDGNSWQAMLSLMNADTVYTVDTNQEDELFIGGSFESLGWYKNVDYLGELKDNQLLALGQGVNDEVYSVDICSNESEDIVAIGGAFTTATDVGGAVVNEANFIVGWDKANKQYVPFGQGLNGPVYEIKYAKNFIFDFNTEYLFVGGEFDEARNSDGSIVPVDNFAVYNLSTGGWENWGGANGPVRSIAWNRDVLYIGGDFNEAIKANGTTIQVSNIAFYRWNGTQNDWHGLDMTFNGEIMAMIIHPGVSFHPQHDVIVGGRFTEILQDDGTLVEVPYFQRLSISFNDLDNDGFLESPWSFANTIHTQKLNGAVHHISGYDFHSAIISGEFTEVELHDGSTIQLNHVSRVRGSYQGAARGQSLNFQNWGDGTNNTVFEHTGLSNCFRPGIFVVGGFSQAGNQQASSLARWNKNPNNTIAFISTSSQSSSLGVGAFMSFRGGCDSRHRKSTGSGSKGTLAEEISVQSFDLDHSSHFDLSFYDNSGSFDPLVSFEGLWVDDDTIFYSLVGVNDTSLYVPNPDGRDLSFKLLETNLTTRTTEASGVGLVIIHTVTDAPALDIITPENDTLVSGLKYTDEIRLVGLEAGMHYIHIKSSEEGTLLYSDSLDLTDKNNKLLLYHIAGFLDPSANNSARGMEGTLADVDHFVWATDAGQTKMEQQITFESIEDKELFELNFILQGSSSSGLPLEYSVVTGNVIIEGDTVSIIGSGRVVIEASQEGDEDYLAAVTVQQEFCVNPAIPLPCQIGEDLLAVFEPGDKQWYLDDTLLNWTNDTLQVEQSGTYKVTATIDGCTSKAGEVYFELTSVDRNRQHFVSILPGNEEIVVSSSGGVKIQSIGIYDLQGRVLYQTENLDRVSFVLRRAESWKGLCIIQVNTERESISKKVLLY